MSFPHPDRPGRGLVSPFVFLLLFSLIAVAAGAATPAKLALTFSPGLRVSLEGVYDYGAFDITQTPPTGTRPELLLLKRYLTTQTLEEHNALFRPGESSGLAPDAFAAWKKRRDVLTRILRWGYDLQVGNERFVALVYDNTYNVSMMTEVLFLKREGEQWHPANNNENRRLRPSQDFFAALTKDGLEALASPQAFVGDAGSRQRLQALVDQNRLGSFLDGTQLLAALQKLRYSADIEERRLAGGLSRPTGVHAIKMLDISELTPAMRAQHQPFLAYLDEAGVLAREQDEILVLVINRQHVRAAQRIREASGDSDTPVRRHLQKIEAIYGTSI